MWIVDRLDHDQNHQCTKAGVVLPYQNGLIIRNVQFYNFDQAGCAALEFTRVGGICTFLCGGFTYQTKGLQWENTNNKVSVFWNMASAQLDGFSLVGEISSGHFRTSESNDNTQTKDQTARYNSVLNEKLPCLHQYNYIHQFVKFFK